MELSIVDRLVVQPSTHWTVRGLAGTENCLYLATTLILRV
jgi:hypothetical protein